MICSSPLIGDAGAKALAVGGVGAKALGAALSVAAAAPGNTNGVRGATACGMAGVCGPSGATLSCIGDTGACGIADGAAD